MPNRVDLKIASGDLSAIDDEGFYGDTSNSDIIEDEDVALDDAYVRECVEIQRLLNRYAIDANKRLRATVKVYSCDEYSQEFLRSLIGG